MPRPPKNGLPSYRHHKPSGQAVVTLHGTDVYLGPYGTRISRDAYDRVVGEYLAQGRRWPPTGDDDSDCTINELLVHALERAERRYRKGDAATSELAAIKNVMSRLRRRYGRTPARAFRPLCLRAMQQAMADDGLCFNTINQHTHRIRRIFRWGVEAEMVPPHVLEALKAVSGIRATELGARTMPPIQPVPEAYIEAIQPFVSEQVWAMVQLQLLTGMRPGEVVLMRGVDLDMSEEVWTYQPARHKTEHHGRPRLIPLGSRAQTIIRRFLKPDLSAYLFAACEAEADRHARQRDRRKTPVQPSQRKRAERSRQRAERGLRRRPPQDRYTPDSYRRAIHRACDQADLKDKQDRDVPLDAERVIEERDASAAVTATYVYGPYIALDTTRGSAALERGRVASSQGSTSR